MESVDLQAATLDALRRWAATDRAVLVGAAWQAGNRNISELARVARVGRDAIYADLRAKGIDPTNSREEPPAMPTTTTDAVVDVPVPGWRHPHLLIVRKHGRHTDEFATKPFTGREPEPQVPEEWIGLHPSDGDGERNWERCEQRRVETRLVHGVWAQARFNYQVGVLLATHAGQLRRTPAEAWQEYAAARDELRSRYAALDSTPDNMWRAALLRIVDAKRPAQLAAEEWDRRAVKFAELDRWLLGNLGESAHPMNAVRDAAKAHGVDVTDWLIGSYSDYSGTGWYPTTPAVEEIESTIKAGDERIRQVQALHGPAVDR